MCKQTGGTYGLWREVQTHRFTKLRVSLTDTHADNTTRETFPIALGVTIITDRSSKREDIRNETQTEAHNRQKVTEFV